MKYSRNRKSELIQMHETEKLRNDYGICFCWTNRELVVSGVGRWLQRPEYKSEISPLMIKAERNIKLKKKLQHMMKR